MIPALLRTGAAGLRPDPRLTVSEWADANRILTRKESPEPGPWRTDRVPYLREIMDCLSDDVTERVVFMKGAQVGATEVALNWIGYKIDHVPGPMLLVEPTVDLAQRVSKQRLSSMIANCPALNARIQPPRSRDSGNTILAKEFPGGILLLAGANSAVGLRSMPIGALVLDERSAYPQDVDGEGDPAGLAEERMENFPHRKVFILSTPTVEGLAKIDEEYDASDRRRWWVPCPDCGTHQVLQWKQVLWPEGKPELAVYVCEHCGCEWDDAKRARAVRKGEWRAERPFAGIAGFHFSRLGAPWAKLGKLAKRFVRAKGSPEKLQGFVNNVLGEVWRLNAQVLSGEGLMGRREEYSADPLPAGVVVLTAGVDVQDDRFEVEVVGWGRGEESWSIDYVIVPADPSSSTGWDRLLDVLQRVYRHPVGVRLRVGAACIDSGHQTQAVYRFCKAHVAQNYWAIKGMGQPGRPILGRPSDKNKRRVNVFPIGTDAAKVQIYARLKLEEAGPGYCHFPTRYTQEYFDQLTVEKVLTKYRRGFPQRVWFKQSWERNEALDCRVYAIAALEGLAVNLDRLADAMQGVESGPRAGGRRRRQLSSGVAA